MTTTLRPTQRKEVNYGEKAQFIALEQFAQRHDLAARTRTTANALR